MPGDNSGRLGGRPDSFPKSRPRPFYFPLTLGFRAYREKLIGLNIANCVLDVPRVRSNMDTDRPILDDEIVVTPEIFREMSNLMENSTSFSGCLSPAEDVVIAVSNLLSRKVRVGHPKIKFLRYS